MTDKSAQIDRLKSDPQTLRSALTAAGARIGKQAGSIGCPFHDDATGSLSMFKNETSGFSEWRCHVCNCGGSVIDVIAKSERITDAEAIDKALQRYAGGAPVMRKPDEQPPLTVPDLKAAVAAAERIRRMKCTRKDRYTNAAGETLMYILRLESADKKKVFWPFHPKNGKLVGKFPEGKRPIFNLQCVTENPDADILIVEGEKCVQAAHEFDVIATTSAAGANAPDKTDWSTLAGRSVTIWPDNDDVGHGYAKAVQAELEALTPPAIVRVVDIAPMGLGKGGDIADLVESWRQAGHDADTIKDGIFSHIEAAKLPPPAWSSVDLRSRSAGALMNCETAFAPTVTVSSGYADLDAALDGMALGDFTLISGGLNSGKTTFAMNIALNLTKAAIPVGVISLEMSRQDVLKLAISIEGGIDRGRLRRAAVTPEEQQDLETAANTVSALPLFILDRADFPGEKPTVEKLSPIIKDGIKYCGWKVVIVDHMRKLGPSDKPELEREQIISDELYNLSHSTGIHLVALQQNNKASFSATEKDGTKKTGLQNIRGGIDTPANADNCIELSRDDWNTDKPVNQAPTRAVVLKARYGPTGTAHFIFEKSTGRFTATETPRGKAIQSPQQPEDLFVFVPHLHADKWLSQKEIVNTLQEKGTKKPDAEALMRRVVSEYQLAFMDATEGERIVEKGKFIATKRGNAIYFKMLARLSP